MCTCAHLLSMHRLLAILMPSHQPEYTLIFVQPPHLVNLNEPDKTIIVQLIRNYCAMSVVERYKQLGKFNLRELSLTGEDAPEASEGDKSSAAVISATAGQPHAASSQLETHVQPVAGQKEGLSTAGVHKGSMTEEARLDASNIQQKVQKGVEGTT